MLQLSRRLTGPAIWFVVCLGVAGLSARTAPERPGQEARPTFRGLVDVIPVDVYVVDSDGRPVRDLTTDQFEVSIDGRRRRVVSAELIEYGPPAPSSSTPAAVTPDSSTPAASAPSSGLTPPRRIIILAVDAASFDQSTGRPVLNAAADYIRRLRPEDEVGLFTFPIGPKVNPTTDHQAVIESLGTIVARRDSHPPGMFNLSPTDIVELSEYGMLTGHSLRLRDQLCPPDDPIDQGPCLALLESEVRNAVLLYEGLAQAGIGALRELMAGLGKVSERKTVVLVSGGTLSSDAPGTRPDNDSLATQAGKIAARANVNLHTLFVDQTWTRQTSAESRVVRTTMNASRDSVLVGRWLEVLSGTAGGSFARVTAGTGAGVFDRLLTETSAYYLLGVEPAAVDRDGRPHEMQVKVDRRRVTVRGRSWVVVPRPGEAPVAASARPRPTAATAPVAAPPPPPVLPPPPSDVRVLADAFDRDDRAAMATAFASQNLHSTIQAFRESDSPWPDSPRRTAAFALDLALAGIRSDVERVRDTALRLMGEYAVRVRRSAESDRFECTWYWTATAGLAGLHNPLPGAFIADRGLERCPDEPSLLLARAVFTDQALLLKLPPPDAGDARADAASAAGEDAGSSAVEIERRVLAQYDAASAHAEVRHEARIRAAFVHMWAGRAAEGLALIDSLPNPAPDPQIRYLGALVRGQLLRLANRPDEAKRAYDDALTVWPSGQAARVALISVLIHLGRGEEAADLAEQVLTAPGLLGDPWWIYWLGDYRLFPSAREQLRRQVEAPR
jgi:VWFA-related protein